MKETTLHRLRNVALSLRQAKETVIACAVEEEDDDDLDAIEEIADEIGDAINDIDTGRLR